MNTDFYRFIVAEADQPDSAELLIFDAIGNWEDIGEVSAKAFSASLASLPPSVRRIELHINSPGGSLFDASAIFSRLADHRSEKIVYIDGLAASAASIVAMVGHKIYMRANATMMIHLPAGLAMGNADDMRKMASALDTITDSMVNVYERRTRQPRDVIRAMLAAETWMSPEQAVANGFADEVRGVIKAAAMVGPKRAVFNGLEFDLSRFHNVPAFSATQTEGVTNMPDKPAPTPTPAPQPAPAPEPEPPKPGENAPQPPAEQPVPGTRIAENEPETPDQGQRPAAALEMPGARAERARVTALMELDRPATHAIITAAIKDGKQVVDVVAACMDAMEKASAQDRRRVDARTLDGIPPSDASVADDNEFGDRLTKCVKAKLKQRGFSSVLHSRS